jgi:hypothetical protein
MSTVAVSSRLLTFLADDSKGEGRSKYVWDCGVG